LVQSSSPIAFTKERRKEKEEKERKKERRKERKEEKKKKRKEKRKKEKKRRKKERRKQDGSLLTISQDGNEELRHGSESQRYVVGYEIDV
jgi:hypothetical protein